MGGTSPLHPVLSDPCLLFGVGGVEQGSGRWDGPWRGAGEEGYYSFPSGPSWIVLLEGRWTVSSLSASDSQCIMWPWDGDLLPDAIENMAIPLITYGVVTK